MSFIDNLNLIEWHTIPSIYRFAAVDQNGTINLFEGEPYIEQMLGTWCIDCTGSNMAITRYKDNYNGKLDWKDTLTNRSVKRILTKDEASEITNTLFEAHDKISNQSAEIEHLKEQIEYRDSELRRLRARHERLSERATRLNLENGKLKSINKHNKLRYAKLTDINRGLSKSIDRARRVRDGFKQDNEALRKENANLIKMIDAMQSNINHKSEELSAATKAHENMSKAYSDISKEYTDLWAMINQQRNILRNTYGIPFLEPEDESGPKEFAPQRSFQSLILMAVKYIDSIRSKVQDSNIKADSAEQDNNEAFIRWNALREMINEDFRKIDYAAASEAVDLTDEERQLDDTTRAFVVFSKTAQIALKDKIDLLKSAGKTIDSHNETISRLELAINESQQIERNLNKTIREHEDTIEANVRLASKRNIENSELRKEIEILNNNAYSAVEKIDSINKHAKAVENMLTVSRKEHQEAVHKYDAEIAELISVNKSNEDVINASMYALQKASDELESKGLFLAGVGIASVDKSSDEYVPGLIIFIRRVTHSIEEYQRINEIYSAALREKNIIPVDSDLAVNRDQYRKACDGILRITQDQKRDGIKPTEPGLDTCERKQNVRTCRLSFTMSDDLYFIVCLILTIALVALVVVVLPMLP